MYNMIIMFNGWLVLNNVSGMLNITDPNKFVFPIPVSEIIADKYLDPNLGY